MNEGDFEINGYRMGLSSPVAVESFDPGNAEWSDQDQIDPIGGSRLFGRDSLSGPTWIFDLATNTIDTAGARSALAGLTKAWRPARVNTPGYEATLRYMIGGEIRRVYGRPRKLAPSINGYATTGVMSAVAEFVTSDHLHYADTERMASLRVVPPPTGGFTAPFTSPILTAATGEIQGLIDDVGGDVPAPFTVTFKGPITNPKISGDGWTIQLLTTIPYDKTVTVDTRKQSVLRNDGANLGGTLSHISRLGNARLQPGPDYFKFSGSDATGTATCTVRWRPAFHSF